MKKILYSAYTKTTAVLLILLISFFGFYQFARNTIPKIYSINSFVSEPDREISYNIKDTFNLIFRELGLATHCYLSSEPANTPIMKAGQLEFYAVCGDRILSTMSAENQEIIKNMLASSDNDGLYHYVTNGGVILENSSNHLSIDHSYPTGFYFSNRENIAPFTIIIVPTESYRTEYLQKTSEAHQAIAVISSEIDNETFLFLWFAAAIIVVLIYLTFVCGRRYENDIIHTLIIDRLWLEILLGIVLAGGILLLIAMGIIADEGLNYGTTNQLYSALFALCGTAIIGIFITALLSVIRNLKNHSFIKHSLIMSAIVWAWHKIKQLYILTKTLLSKKTYTLVASAILLYGVLTFLLPYRFIILTLTIAMISLAMQAILGFDDLRKGIDELCDGNTDYKINNTQAGVIGDLCRQVDNIGAGIGIAVENQLSAERMKSQLITNVSHDLKTPLTAIINYTELLCELELSPEEANEYAKIIQSKAARLKALTSDLFDISKVQSGNEIIAQEDIDITLLIKQSLGELDEEIKKSEFEINTTLPESCMIKGDGAKLSRVFENLITNALKYSLKGTRIYITANDTAGSVTIEIKNISAYPLDFDTEEITERFMRGDSSRSTEGNGLGLAIAKSYTEAIGGEFKVITDGDLFKAVLRF